MGDDILQRLAEKSGLTVRYRAAWPWVAKMGPTCRARMCRHPHTGSGILASALAMDKRTKQVWHSLGSLTPRGPCPGRPRTEARVAELGFPLTSSRPMKVPASAWLRSPDVEALIEAWQDAARYDSAGLVEQAIDGPAPSPCCVVKCCRRSAWAPHTFYDYDAKYLADDTSTAFPVASRPTKRQELKELTARACEAVGTLRAGACVPT